MLLRFVVENFRSFRDSTEFNLFPYRKLGKLKHHIQRGSGVDALKLSAIYGANASGKSNFIRAIRCVQHYLVKGELPPEIFTEHFRLDADYARKPTVFGVEFVAQEQVFLYALKFDRNRILGEELYRSGLGNKSDEPIFVFDAQADTVLRFSDAFYASSKNKLLAELLNESLLKKNRSVLLQLTEIENNALADLHTAIEFLKNGINLITPDTRPTGFLSELINNTDFLNFTRNIVRSFHVGIQDLKIERIPLRDYFGENEPEAIRHVLQQLNQNPPLNIQRAEITMRSETGDELVITSDPEGVFVHRLSFVQKTENEQESVFLIDDQSDGTRRLLDFLPAFLYVLQEKKTVIIDEIERSLHPILIKQLIQKFSADATTKGQLIFTTHESNLLDLKIFRRDEIWFTEKSPTGVSNLYPLSRFQEHHTIDVRRGYLSGRYGAIPFMGNLQDLNWQEYDTAA